MAKGKAKSPHAGDHKDRLALLRSIPKPLSVDPPVPPPAGYHPNGRNVKPKRESQIGESNGTKPVLASTLFPEEKEPVVPPRRLEEKVIFPKDRLKRIATRYREKGRELKHAGDNILRENATTDAATLSIIAQLDAVLLYVFSFWCDDTASKTCAVQNWQSIFGLLNFVKSRAEKASLSIIIGVCFRIEAHIVQTLSNYEQKSASYKYAQFINPTTATTINGSLAPSPHSKPSSSTSDKAISPQSLPANSPRDGAPPLPSHPPPPPPPPPPSTAATPLALLKSFSKASGEIFRIQRSWEESSLLLSPQIIASLLPETWKLCTVENVNVDSTGMILPRRPWRFAWPVEPTRTGSIPHVVAFSRAVLEEWAKGRGIDFKLAVVDEEV